MEQLSADTITGNLGQPGRLRVTPRGDLVNLDGTRRLEWFIAADDRWHIPAEETAVRQRRLGGAPVTETRVRVPNGDVVQRVYSVADGGGIAVVEIENESTLPVAVAFDRRDVLTERPIGTTPVEGIDLGPDAFVLPLGHKATLRIGVPLGVVAHPTGAPLPRVASCSDVVKGWTETAQRAGSVVLPESDLGLVERLIAARCDLLLAGVPDAADHPAAFLIGLDQSVRMGAVKTGTTIPGARTATDELGMWMPDVANAVAMLAKHTGWYPSAALAAADRILFAGSEDRARRDLAKLLQRLGLSGTDDASPEQAPDAGTTDLELVAWIERRLVSGGALLSGGVPTGWRGQSFECHHLPSLTGSTVSFAVRWHGERPAVLWEQHGPPVELSAPTVDADWSTSAAAGEALWHLSIPVT